MSKNHPTSLWAATAPTADEHPSLSEDITVDALVIGGGFTGLRAALHLAEAGRSVALVEAGPIGYGASGRNGGQVNPMLPVNLPDDLKRSLGAGAARRLIELSLNSADELFDFIRDRQVHCDARQNGWLRVDHFPGTAKKAAESAAEWNAVGANFCRLEGAQLQELTGSPVYQSGTLIPSGGLVHPLKLCLGLARLAAGAGARLFAYTAAGELHRVGDQWRVRCPHGQITTNQVVVATNGYSRERDKLVPGLARSVLPLVPIQIATDPLPAAVVSSILPQGHSIADSRRVIMYARREPDNAMVFGSVGHLGLNGKPTGHGWMMKDAARVFPQLQGVAWRYRWGGTTALTDDYLPHIHRPDAGLFVGIGYSGRGVALANCMGRILAEAALGKPEEAWAIAPRPIKAFKARAIKQLGLPFAIQGLRVRDWLEYRQIGSGGQ